MSTATVPQEESDEFIQGAINELEQDPGRFVQNVSEVAASVIRVDEEFGNVTRGLNDMNEKHPTDFPSLGAYLKEWQGYKKRWTESLFSSRDVASEQAAVLQRFDRVFLDMVGMIETDQDRQDVIVEFEQFTKENHDGSQEMAQGVIDLKRDIETFVARFDASVEETGTELQQPAQTLRKEMNECQVKIQELTKQILEAIASLLTGAAPVGTMMAILELTAPGTYPMMLIAQRAEKTRGLSNSHAELDDINQKQEGLAHVATQIDGARPNIALVCEKLALFGEIWSSVRAQALHFNETLKTGLEVLKDQRFQRELKLTKMLCASLRDGLIRYASELGNL